jgi:rRNA maturation protein Nop10
MKKQNRPDFPCPNCGETVPGNRQSCPHCGSDEKTGWAAGAEFSHLDPSFDEKDYGHALRAEFGGKPGKRFWRIAAAFVSAVLIALWFLVFFR